jgi:predicted MFS family arabinose efflux permease
MSGHGSEQARTGLASTLKDPRLRRLYGAEIVSGAGDGVFWVALIVFLSDQPRFGLWLTLAVVARLAPRALLSVPAGSLVDRSNLRTLVVGVDLARAAVMVTMAVLVSVDAGALAVMALVLLSYTIAAPTRPALSAIVPAVAGERHLAGANAVLSTIRQIMTFVGPLLGVVVAAWSPSVGFAVNAVTFALSGLAIAAISGIPDRSQQVRASRREATRLGPISAFRDGIGVLGSNAALSPLVALIGVMYFVRGAEMVLLVYVVRERLGGDVERIGLLNGAVGLGALLAVPIAWRAANSPSPVRPIVLSLLATAIPTAALAVVTTTAGASIVLVPVGVGMVVFEVVVVVMVQRMTPPRTLGRVFGAVNGASNTGKLAGALVAPLMIAVVGVEESLVAVGAIVLVAGAAAVWPLVRIGRVTAARQRDLAPTVSALRALAIFEGASSASLERIAAQLTERDLGADTVVIRQGEPADDLYIARSGALVVVRDEVAVGDIRTGEWFGEIGLLEERPRTATVTTVEPTTVWQIPGDVFLDALDDVGAAPSALLDAMADRIASHAPDTRSIHS